jgi:hypothetical protein
MKLQHPESRLKQELESNNTCYEHRVKLNMLKNYS